MTATTGLNGFVVRLRAGLKSDPRADGELVREFAATASDAAFAELVRRFTPLVWGVCRRTIHDRQLAEDAFQATFVVLARKAGAIQPAAVAGWLHTVAVHTSTRARAMADRRKARTQPLADHDLAEAVAEPADPEVVRALDEEISRLPESLRAAVALCELGGVSRKDAAARLGIAEGTLSSRLASARKRLAAKLRARGVVLAVALALVSRTEAAPAFSPSASGVVSTLADGAIRTMFLTKLKLTATAAVLLAALLGGGVSLAAPPDRDRFQIKAPVPKKEREGVIAVGIQEDDKNRIDLFTPAGQKITTIPLDPHPMYHLALSRDGKRVAVWSWDELRIDRDNRFPGGQPKHTGSLLVFDVDTPDKPMVKLGGVQAGGCVFAPDGKSLYLNEVSDPDEKKPARENTISTLDLKTGEKEPLKLPADHLALDVSPDGKTLLVVSGTEKVKGEVGATTYLVPLDTLKPKLATEANVRSDRFSPDGARLVGHKYSKGGADTTIELVTVEVTTGKDTPVKLDADTYRVWRAVWSPDGKRMLVQRDVLLPGEQPRRLPKAAPQGVVFEGPKTRPEVAIRNSDGSDPKPLVELKKDTHVFGIDWR